MTISREYRNGPYNVQCDECMDVDELEGNEFAELVENAKERGYTPYFEGAWKHRCNQCQKAYLQGDG